MAVGHVHRSVSATTTNESCDPPPPYPSTARAKDCPSNSERGGLRFDARQHNADCRLGAPRRKQLRVAQVVTSSIKNAQDSSKVDRSAPAIDRVAPAICDDLHNCAGWPPSKRLHGHGPDRNSSSSAVFDSSACYMIRSMYLERNVHFFPSEARVLSKPSLKNG